jgi:hypothetical protein
LVANGSRAINNLSAVSTTEPKAVSARRQLVVNADEEKRKVRAVWDGGVEALTSKDWDSYADFWLHDASIQVIDSAERNWTTGWEQLAARYKALLASPARLSGTTRRFDVSISPSCDVAWATIEVDISVDGVEHRSWEVAVFRKIDDRWRAVLGFDATLPPATGV